MKIIRRLFAQVVTDLDEAITDRHGQVITLDGRGLVQQKDKAVLRCRPKANVKLILLLAFQAEINTELTSGRVKSSQVKQSFIAIDLRQIWSNMSLTLW